MTRIAPLTDHKPAPPESALERELLRRWPGLDPVELSRCGGDPVQIAGLIARHDQQTMDDATGTVVKRDRAEPPFYFG